MAIADRDDIWRRLPAGAREEVASVYEELAKALKDRKLMAEETKSATTSQNQAFAQAKVWRREVASWARAAARLGMKLPDGLLSYRQVRTVPDMIKQLEEMTGMLEKSLSLFPGEGAQELFGRGRTLLETLRAYDAEQEKRRLSDLPAATRNLYLAKGRMYLFIKAINDAARSLLAAQPARAAEYNLSILYRRGGAEKTSGAPSPAP